MLMGYEVDDADAGREDTLHGLFFRHRRADVYLAPPTHWGLSTLLPHTWAPMMPLRDAKHSFEKVTLTKCMVPRAALTLTYVIWPQ